MEILCISSRYVEPEMEDRLDKLFGALKAWRPHSEELNISSSYKTPFEKMAMNRALSRGFNVRSKKNMDQIGVRGETEYKRTQEIKGTTSIHPKPEKLTTKAKKDLGRITELIRFLKGSRGQVVVLAAPGPSGRGRAKYAKDLARHLMVPYLDITSPKFFQRLDKATKKTIKETAHNKCVEDYRKKQKEQSKRERQARSLRDLKTFLLSTFGVPRRDVSVYTEAILEKTAEMIETQFGGVKDLGYINIEQEPHENEGRLNLGVQMCWDEKMDRKGRLLSDTQMEFVIDLPKKLGSQNITTNYQFWVLKKHLNGRVKRVRKPPHIDKQKPTGRNIFRTGPIPTSGRLGATEEEGYAPGGGPEEVNLNGYIREVAEQTRRNLIIRTVFNGHIQEEDIWEDEEE